eukprot:763101-Hanusia_phi.AAC.1
MPAFACLPSRVHDRLGLLPDVCPGCHCSAEHVACGQLWDVPRLHDLGAVSSLPCKQLASGEALDSGGSGGRRQEMEPRGKRSPLRDRSSKKCLYA